MQLQKGDILYLFSDGYRDQLGGPDTKKMMHKKFKDLILAMANKPMQRQKNILHAFIERWKRTTPQTDDICVMGYRYHG
jgi:serine phosphatase RsbU (regulator of sigma subunit)